MLVHKGGKIKNWGGECRDVTPIKSLSQSMDGCERKIEVFVKIQKKKKKNGGGGGGGSGGVGLGGQGGCEQELKFL